MELFVICLIASWLIVRNTVEDRIALAKGKPPPRHTERMARMQQDHTERMARIQHRTGPTVGEAVAARIADRIAHPKPPKEHTGQGPFRVFLGHAWEDAWNQATEQRVQHGERKQAGDLPRQRAWRKVKKTASKVRRPTVDQTASERPTVWDLQNQFEEASTEKEREAIRDRIRAAGWHGIADTLGHGYSPSAENAAASAAADARPDPGAPERPADLPWLTGTPAAGQEDPPATSPGLLPHVDPDTLREMRSWVEDCHWGDLDRGDSSDLTDEQVIAGIDRHYSGGVDQFLRDSTNPHDPTDPPGTVRAVAERIPELPAFTPVGTTPPATQQGAAVSEIFNPESAMADATTLEAEATSLVQTLESRIADLDAHNVTDEPRQAYVDMLEAATALATSATSAGACFAAHQDIHDVVHSDKSVGNGQYLEVD